MTSSQPSLAVDKSVDRRPLPSGSMSGPVFSIGERVLCFHGQLIYEAKVLEVRPSDDDNTEYLIHYAGWNKKWDEYVPEYRILKRTDENLKLQKDHKIAVDVQYAATRRNLRPSTAGGKSSSGKGKSGKSFAGSISSRSHSPNPDLDDEPEDIKPSKSKLPQASNLATTSDSNVRKRKLDSLVETEEQFTTKHVVEIHFPKRFRVLLVDDFDFINRQKKLHRIPANFTVDKILEDYNTYMKREVTDIPTYQLQFLNGLRDTFNEMLGSQLLYRFERQQYSTILEGIYVSQEAGKDTRNSIGVPANVRVKLSAKYGVIHLMRMLSKVGNYLVSTTMNDSTLDLYQTLNTAFLDYVLLRFDELFKPDNYESSSPEYQRLSPI